MTWQDFLDSIPDRLNRDDLSADFVEEVANEQIALFGPELFFPSEITDYSIITQPGEFFYRLPAGFQRLTFVRVQYGGIWIPVSIVDRYTDILLVDPLQPPFISLPVSLCRVYGNQLRLFPTPNGQYPVELTMFGTAVGPTARDDSANFWVNDGNVFLRAATCLAICMEKLDNTTPNAPRIQMWMRRRDEALAQLQIQTQAATQPSIIRQWL
jgi:hypothetical protein